jgi:hypothetical protein
MTPSLGSSVLAAPSAWKRVVTLIVPLALASGCNQQQAAVAAPSGEQAGYAERYPAKLEALRARITDGENEVKTALPEFKTLPDALKNPDYSVVKTVVERADQEGRSASYADGALEAESVKRFLEEEKEPLRQKVAGGVNYAAKQKNCAEDLGGAAIVSMERGIDKQLEERMRAHSEAHRFIEDHQDEIGKPNVELVEKHAERITRTSHLAFVRLELYRRELETVLADSSAAESTLDRVVQESNAVLADASSSRTKKQVAEKRKAAAEQARSRIEADVTEARKTLEGMEQRIATVRKDYETALDALTDALDKRAEAKK